MTLVLVTKDEVYPVMDVVVRDGVAREIETPILEQHRLHAAVHIANTEIRYAQQGEHDAADAAHARLFDVIQSSRCQLAFLDSLIRRLGRNRSLAIGIDQKVVDATIPHVV